MLCINLLGSFFPEKLALYFGVSYRMEVLQDHSYSSLLTRDKIFLV